jgi:serine phosphatase RsbU (regulator of sigma subunit)
MSATQPRSGWRERNRDFQRTLRTMSMKSRVLLGVAIFLTFASFGFSGDSLSLAPDFWTHIVLAALFSGVVGVAYAAFGFGYRIALPIAIVINIAGAYYFGQWSWDPGGRQALSAPDVQRVEGRLQLTGGVRIVVSMIAYSSFIALLRIEGKRSIGMYTEIRLARDIHAALVPIVDGRNAVLEWYGVSHPSGEVGGDLVDVVDDASRPWTACVSDVSGHGVAAGVLMGMFKTALRSAYRTSTDPGAVLVHINDVLSPLKRPNMFVTAAALEWPAPDRCHYVLAGHPSLIHVSRATGEARWVGESQIALGFIERTTYETRSFDVASGDLVAVVTDGLLELFDRRQHELGADGLLRIVQSAASAHPTLVETAAEIFATCAKHGAQTDDQSLLLVRRI